MYVARNLSLALSLSLAAACAGGERPEIAERAPLSTTTTINTEASTAPEVPETTVPPSLARPQDRTGKELAADVDAANALADHAIAALEADAKDGTINATITMGTCAVMAVRSSISDEVAAANGLVGDEPEIQFVPNPADVTIEDPEGTGEVNFRVGYHPVTHQFLRGQLTVIEEVGDQINAYVVEPDNGDLDVVNGPFMSQEVEAIIASDGGIYTVPENQLVMTIASSVRDFATPNDALESEFGDLLCRLSQVQSSDMNPAS